MDNDSRRHYVRIPVAPRAPIQVRFADGRAYVAIDISVYGIAFACDLSESSRFAMAQIWPDMRFNLDRRSVCVRAKVVHLQSDAVPGKLKVGVEFAEIQAEDVFAVSEFITRYSELGKVTQIKVTLPRAKKKPALKKPTLKKKPARRRPATKTR